MKTQVRKRARSAKCAVVVVDPSLCKKCGQCGGKGKKSDLCNSCFSEVHRLCPDFKLFKQRKISDHIERVLFDHFRIRVKLNDYIKDLKLYPDIIFRLQGVTVIIEVDENQHKYGYKDEKKRTDLLKQHFQKLFLVRINPDKFAERPPLFEKRSETTIDAQEVEIQMNMGEAEVRMREIEENLVGVVGLIFCDTHLDRMANFTELRLFFD